MSPPHWPSLARPGASSRAMHNTRYDRQENQGVQGGNDNIVFIPQIALDANKDEFPIPLQHLQFPVRLAYAMTINKAQGQSVKHVGLDLCTLVFSHGQLYICGTF